jgi:Spx/MgsR family transcriptional regulator
MKIANITLYGIANCDTVKKSRAWLSAQNLDYQFHDFKKQGLPAPLLDTWITALGWQPLLNTRGNTWHRLDEATRAATTDAASARALMLEQPSIVKRPVVQWADGRLTVGFSETSWREHLG